MFSFSSKLIYWQYYQRRQGLHKKSEMEMNTCSSNAMNWLSFSRRCSWRSWICFRCCALSASMLSRSLLQEIRKKIEYTFYFAINCRFWKLWLIKGTIYELYINTWRNLWAFFPTEMKAVSWLAIEPARQSNLTNPQHMWHRNLNVAFQIIKVF